MNNLEEELKNLGVYRNTPYRVSRHGEVFRVYKSTKTLPERLKQISTASLNSSGYPRIHISFGGEEYSIAAHIIVAEVFIGPRPPGMQINHKNGIKTDIRVENLEYVTPSENVRHAFRLGLMKRRPQKLTEKLVKIIRNSTLSHRELAKKHNIGKSTVIRVRLGLTWKTVKHGIKKRGLFPKAGVGKKLTPQQVLEIRESPLNYEQLGKKYNINPNTVSLIVKRKIWKSI